MLNKPEEYKRMAAVEKNHWWYRVLHERVLAKIKHLPEYAVGWDEEADEGRGGVVLTPISQILDAGCGTGGLMLKMAEKGIAVFGADVSEYAVNICAERGLNVIQTDVRNLPQKLAGQTFDAIICNDVLCYFTMDEIPAIIEGLKTLLKPGGLLIMNNPAFSSFSGNHDVAVGIKTRFKPKELKGIIMNYELLIMHYSCWPFLLSPAIYLTRKLQGKKSGGEAVSDIDMPPRWLNSLLYGICKLEMKLFKHAPWGSSVFIVAKREG